MTCSRLPVGGLLALLVALLTVACSDDGSSGSAQTDTGMTEADTGVADTAMEADTATEADTAEPDTAPPYTCATSTTLEGMFEGTVSVTLDTSMTEERPRDLGLACGNTGAELRWAPQEVVEFLVPGQGEVGVTFDTVFPETDSAFNTVIQVRRDCESVPVGIFPPTCFDNVSAEEVRTQGGVSAMGGDTLYFIVTGFSEPPAESGQVDKGTVRLDITVAPNSPPSIDAASFLLSQEDTLITVEGSDADGDAQGVAMNFYAGDELLDIYGDGEATEDGDIYTVFFEEASDEVAFSESVTVFGAQVALAGFLRSVNATRVRLFAFDRIWTLSEGVDVEIAEAEVGGLGDPCGEANQICVAGELECVDAVCEPVAAVQAACEAATAVEVPAIMTEAVSVTQEGTTGAGMGDFAPLVGCIGQQPATLGAETIYSVEVPEGVVVDLAVTSNLDGTGDTDTFLYLRATCADAASELACNDDRAAMDLRSDIAAADLAAGTYFLFVETYGGLQSGTAPHALQFTFTPVLPSGEACDDDGVLNRCQGDPCADGVCP